MDQAERQRIEAAGYRVTTLAEFLQLTPADVAYIAMKTALADELKATRGRLGLTQSECAARLGVTQPYFARLEAGGSRTVTLDALMDALLQLGLSQREVGLIVAGETPKREAKPQKSPAKPTVPALTPKARRVKRAKVLA